MLVHPEIYAFLNKQNSSKELRKRNDPLISRGKKTNKGASEDSRNTQAYEPDLENKIHNEIEYLNERKSNLNFYA